MLAQPYLRHANIEHDIQHHNALIDRHHLVDFVIDVFSNVFAPMAYVQCLPSELSMACNATIDRQYTTVDDDDYTLVDEGEEQDGGPLCREATIASWKSKAKPAPKGRRRSIQWLGSVIKREFGEHKAD